MAADLAFSPKRNRTRSPAYPYLDLPTALEKAATLWRAEGRHAASVAVVMQHWGYKEESSTGYSCVAALKKFGLVDHDGIGETRQIRLSNLALRILLDEDPQSDERRAALREAALGPRIHAELWEKYSFDLPSDQSLKRFLVLERSFNEAAVDELLAEYKQTMAFAGLARAGNGGGQDETTPGARTAGAVPGVAAAPVQLAPAAPRPAALDVPLPADRVAPAVGHSFREPPPRRPETPASPGFPAPQPRALPPRAVGPAVATPAVPAGRGEAPVAFPQRDLFGERNAADATGETRAEEASSLVRPSPADRSELRPERPGPLAAPRRELPVPLDNGLVASVPYPMSEEDFELLIDTLQLWKKRLVQLPSR